MDKKEQRKRAKELRESLSIDQRKHFSEVICQKIHASEIYLKSKAVLTYSPFRTEIMLQEFNQQVIEDGKMLYFPKTDWKKKEMEFYRVDDLSQLAPGYQGILEPPCSECYDGTSPCLMIMPGLAFDTNGNRIGYGGGYYDRYVEKHPHLYKLMVAFSCQQFDIIDAWDCDQKADCIMTETNVFWNHGNKRLERE